MSTSRELIGVPSPAWGVLRAFAWIAIAAGLGLISIVCTRPNSTSESGDSRPGIASVSPAAAPIDADILSVSSDSVTGEDAAGPSIDAATPIDAATVTAASTVPHWAADAIFYQVFPERFCNGDPANDPTRESLEFSDSIPESWSISPWTGDWYARADWEKQLGPNFFDNGVFHRRYGGDLQGVIDKLDYLTDLGINAIYFNPVFHARSLHKYDGSSLHHIDPHFGPDPRGDLALMASETSDPVTWQWTAADKLFLELLQQAHARGLRVVIDGVFNHTGRDFFAFADVRKYQVNSKYRDWYIVQFFDDPATPQNEFRYKGWWGVETLPEFADNDQGDDLHAGPKQYDLDCTARWMDPDRDGDPADGVDGWRLDAASEVPIGFWRDWNSHARRINPQCYTVAEVWTDARKFLAETGFTATMNYHGFSFPVKGFLIDGALTASAAAHDFDARRNGYPLPLQYALQNLVDSHDTDRLASMIVNAGRRPYSKLDRYDYDTRASPRFEANYNVRKPSDHERRIQRLVALLQMTYVGAPMIYYGTEAGMWGADDPCDRMPMVWPQLTYDERAADPLGRPRAAESVTFDNDLFNFYRAVIHFRRQSPALRHGDLEFMAMDDAAQFLGFRRANVEERLLVGLNRGDSPYGWEIPLADQEEIAQIFTASGSADLVGIERGVDRATVTVPAVDGVVLRIQSGE